MQVYVVETGSFGNCYLIEYKPKTYIMVDDGLPMPLVKQFVERNLKSSMNRITFCIISHLHGDHLMESNLFNEYSIPIYIPEENLITNEIRRNLITKLTYTVGKTFYPIPNVKITSFPVPHDSYNLGFRISIRDNGVWKEIVYLTDFGNIKSLPYWKEMIDLYMIEANYDDVRILHTDNQWNRRSRSDSGHSSLQDTLKYLLAQPTIKTSKVLLVHGSSDNVKEEDYKIFDSLPAKEIKIAKPGINIEI